ncbi:DUF5674 family protein [Candidatus Gracilibacteria bacterium]|nr:DUF5674 family protein [Candidatus Gracilibacteria bacterium]
MKFIDSKISKSSLAEIAKERFGDMVKAVVDIELKIMVVGGELHADEEAMLLERDCKQENLWGINIYVEKTGDEMIEFDSMINIRPRQNNRSRDVLDPAIREKIKIIVNNIIEEGILHTQIWQTEDGLRCHSLNKWEIQEARFID